MEAYSVTNILASAQSNLYDFVSNNILFFAIVIAAITGKIKESSKQNRLTVWVVYFMGTFFHELAHFLVSLVTFGKPYWFSVIPHSEINKESDEKMITLGHVKSSNVRWWNVFFISMAPFLLLPLSYYVYLYFFDYVEMNLWTLILYVFTIVSLLFSSIPSGADFKNVFNRDLPANIIAPVIFGAAFYLYHTELSARQGGLF